MQNLIDRLGESHLAGISYFDWGLALVVNNLLDKQYVQYLSNLSSPVGSPYYAGLTEPRRIQLEVKVKL